MNFTTIIKGGAKVASRIGLQLSKHAPEILTGLRGFRWNSSIGH